MKNWLPLLFIFLSIMGCKHTENQIQAEDSYLSLSWHFVENRVQDGSHSACFVLRNTGKKAIGDKDWSIYMNQMGRGVIKGSVGGNMDIEHINGDLIRLFPLAGFSLHAGDSVKINYRKSGNLSRDCEAPLGPFLVQENGDFQKLYTIADYHIEPLRDFTKVFPEGSGIPYPDAAWVFEKNKGLTFLEGSMGSEIIPTPQSSLKRHVGKRVDLDISLPVNYQSGLENEAAYLAGMLKEISGGQPEIAPGITKGTEGIKLAIRENLSDNEEAYLLEIKPDGEIIIVGATSKGVFYGAQSLLGLLAPEIWAGGDNRLTLPVLTLEDAPAFPYRGMHIDLARNYIETADLKKLIRLMAFYKLNKLHLHLTDDEGWRLDIPSLPELTSIGSQRRYCGGKQKLIQPAYGSGPFPGREASFGSGFISREAFIDLLQYADNHHIEIIPEINFPGHARAAIFAMEARYTRLLQSGVPEEEAAFFRLIDPDDSSVYNSAQNFNDNIACVCREGLYNLFETVVDEIDKMYKDAGLKLRVLHTGGDEVPHGSWTGSPICLDFIEEHPEIGVVENLQAYCGERFLKILSARGIVMAGWEEVAMRKDEQGTWQANQALNGGDVLPYVWNSLGKNLDLGNRLANAGFPVVLCNVSNYYFDLAYSHHPAEPGLAWGGFVNTRSAFELLPYDVFKSTLTDKWGKPFPDNYFRGMEALSKEARKNILGLQAQLWTETVKGGEMAEYYYLPKLIALAERAWCGQEDWAKRPDRQSMINEMNQDWNRFANVVGRRELPRLDYLFDGFSYRLPPPGAIIRDGFLHANVDFPGLAIRYTTDGSVPDANALLYTGPVELEAPVKLRSFDTRGRGSRVSEVPTY